MLLSGVKKDQGKKLKSMKNSLIMELEARELELSL
jgi:hypothetical protein